MFFLGESADTHTKVNEFDL